MSKNCPHGSESLIIFLRVSFLDVIVIVCGPELLPNHIPFESSPFVSTWFMETPNPSQIQHFYWPNLFAKCKLHGTHNTNTSTQYNGLYFMTSCVYFFMIYLNFFIRDKKDKLKRW